MTTFPRRKSILFSAMLCLFVSSGFAQSEAPLPPHNRALFEPLDWPTPNEQRTAEGRPGSGYWQQRADYDISVTLDPFTHRIAGTVRINYTNNSKQALQQLWLQLDQNAFTPESRSAQLHGDDSRWRGSFEEGGYEISDLYVSRNGNLYSPSYSVDDTRLRIALENPLPGGSVIDISMEYSYTVPEFGADRTGRMEVENGTVYQIAQWYPRMYVFDDVNGWNAMPYLGQGEFYTEYGDFNLAITTPSDFVVVATGELLNPDEVFTETQRERLDRARESSDTVPIIRERELGRSNTRPADTPTLTWQFSAQNVRDVAWGASQAFILDATSWKDVLIMSAYPKEAIGTPDDPGWERATEYARHTIQFYSNTWYPYPYPVAINVAGTAGGMEYPMIVFCDFQARGQGLFGVTDHEFGHTWFPMIVGSDERRYAWMDEGFNTFLNYYSNLDFYGSEAQRLERYMPEFIAGRMQEPIADQPIMTYPDQLRAEGLGFLAYRKPGFGLLLLREYILGPERFDAAFKAYIDGWAFKHPQPTDFFRTIEQVAGEDLGWFWRGWFYGTDVLDQEIILVRDSNEKFAVLVQHRTDLILPIELEVEHADGTIERRRIPIESFFEKDFAVVATSDDRRIVRITIDPDGRLPDVDRSNNVWSR